MFLRVFVLFLALVGSVSAGVLGVRWLGGASANAETIEARRSTDDPAVKGALDRIDGLAHAAYFLLAAVPLGIAGGVLAGVGRGKLAAPVLLLAVPAPAIFAMTSLVATICFLVGGCLALMIRAPANKSEEGIKACWTAFKGWLNIGGVKVSFVDVSPTVPKSGNLLVGKVQLKSKTEQHVVGVHYKLFRQRSKGSKEDKETKEQILGETSLPLGKDLQAGESLSLDFRLPYTYARDLKDMGGVLGGVGKLAAFTTGEKDEYFLLAEAEVPGTLFEPSAKLKVQMVD